MAKQVTGEDMRADKDVYDSPEIVNKVAQSLAKLETEAEPSTPEPADDSKSIPEPPAVEEPSAAKEDPTPEPAADQELAAAAKPPIPDNYYRAATQSGLSPDDVDKLYQTDPKLTVQFLEKLYQDRNNLSQTFSRFGRKAIELRQQKVEPTPPPPPEPETLNFKKLKEKFEDDPWAAMEAMNDFYSKRPTPQPVAQAPAPPRQEAVEENMAIAQELQQFFDADGMKTYGDFYGASKDESGRPVWNWNTVLTPGQVANRNAVIRLADQIIAGAELTGETVPVAQALEMAHMQVSAPIAKQALRAELVSKVKKRAKGVTLAPSESKQSPSGGKTSGKDLEIKTKGRLKKVFG